MISFDGTAWPDLSLGGSVPVLIKCWQRAVPLPQMENWLSWRIMWVEEEVFYEQNQHRGRKEEVFRGLTELPEDVGRACRQRGGLCRQGDSLPGQPPAGPSEGWDSVCVSILWCP